MYSVIKMTRGFSDLVSVQNLWNLTMFACYKMENRDISKHLFLNMSTLVNILSQGAVLSRIHPNSPKARLKEITRGRGLLKSEYLKGML